MVDMSVEIQNVSPDDAAELAAIYAPYVERTAVSFEYVAPTPEEFRRRIIKTIEKYPYIKAVENGEILGYAYAGAFKERAAYDWDVETSIYIRQDARRRGLGRLLYGELIRRLGVMGIVNVYACVACTEVEDEYLTNASIDFHRALGFKTVGLFPHCALKFNRWYDMQFLSFGAGHFASANIFSFGAGNTKVAEGKLLGEALA